MNLPGPDHGGDATVLKICVADHGHETPVPIAIRVISHDHWVWVRNGVNHLPVLLHRRQCGQKPPTMVGPALQKIALVKA
jgi:hypothetical protein